MDDTHATKLVQHADGTQVLLLRQVTISVRRGPDKGRELLIDTPRVRVGTAPDCDLQLSDPAVSRYHFELEATDESYLLRDLGSTNGTLQGDVQLVEAKITGPVTLRIGEKTLLHIAPTQSEIQIPLSRKGSCGGLYGQSRQIRQVFAILERVAPSKTTVLLEGESGTGKEVAAEAIHALSGREEAPFVVVDCGAIPSTLMESELFGHQKGAFTGAREARPGALEQAHGGTVFLDEIGELPLDLQPRLLRFLEGQQVKRIGAAHHREVDVRIIAATNRKLALEVEQQRFRKDLYFRLSVLRVEMPPLRQRPEDILLLARHFAETLDPDPQTIITDEVVGLFVSYGWPGNVRELRNVVERLALLPELTAQALRGATASVAQGPAIGPLAELSFHEARRRWQDLFERQYLVTQLSKTSGAVTRAAENAGLPRQTFNRLLRRHRLRTDRPED